MSSGNYFQNETKTLKATYLECPDLYLSWFRGIGILLMDTNHLGVSWEGPCRSKDLGYYYQIYVLKIVCLQIFVI